MKEENVAILLISLDEDIAARVMKHFTPAELERIGRRMSQLTSVSEEDINIAAKEFCELVREKGYVVGVSYETIRNLMVKAKGEPFAHTILANIEKSGQKALDDSLIRKLREADPQILVDFIKTEHPQTIALILSCLSADSAAKVLERFSHSMQVEIIKRMATINTVPYELIEDIARTMEKEVFAVGGAVQQAGGVPLVAEIMNKMSRARENEIMKFLDESIPDVAVEIRKKMFSFEDVLKLDDRALQAVLREISTEDLAKALKVVDEDMRQPIYRNMSKRGADMLKEDIAIMPPLRLSEIEKSQRAIVDATKKLEMEGKIVIIRGGGEDQYV